MLLSKFIDPTDTASADVEISALTLDSRAVKPGHLFAAMPGSNVDGAKFVPAAIEAGASAVLVADEADIGDVSVPVVRARDVRRSISLAAARFYGKQPATMAAVTGTAGKTSVASFLRQIWQQMDQRVAMIGTTGVFAPGRSDYGSLTTPDPVRLHELLAELATDNVTHCSMEASSHGLDQRRLDGVKLAAAGFTNLGRDHLDYHADLGEYLAAKMRLFDTLMASGQPAVVFSDDPYSDAVIAVCKERGLDLCTVGHKGSFLCLKRLEQHRYSQIGEIEHAGQIHRIELPLAGEFQMSNALVAAGLAITTGSDAASVLAALENIKGASGRLELIGQTADGAPAYVDYAHKPEALENVLEALKPYTTGRLIVVFGCGGDRDPGKRPIMGEIARRLADVVIVTDDNPRTENAADVRAQILAAVPEATEIGDRREAIEFAVSQMNAGDSLVVAGKGHEEGQIVGTQTLPFSDHQVVAQALENTK
ncbi:MAG: UDP-N-acetylmuramoyl-L-alanyl-D-glutamate--2,6-diaminopimelate ligase [Rhizobiaceae bacterium]|nr:UDP-N-acetylmuramoyl-L-alanyl-D-glutamate--2,6-diaminopimelate ligase [Hyphomicrobiales bacterium]NRB32606.1 UDP-N-acetylmuramoyl-L-alanyl-D-glutamate--2,6-diaminopimelate ligase [Rhizobiaceae bacterium]